MSQPSLSTQITQVEASLGVQALFERDRRSVTVTTAGLTIERALTTCNFEPSS